jgi:hypothetical protein
MLIVHITSTFQCLPQIIISCIKILISMRLQLWSYLLFLEKHGLYNFACAHCTPLSNSGSCKGTSWPEWGFSEHHGPFTFPFNVKHASHPRKNAVFCSRNPVAADFWNHLQHQFLASQSKRVTVCMALTVYRHTFKKICCPVRWGF